MLIYFFVFAFLGLFFPPFWVLAFIFLLGSLFKDLGTIIFAIIAFPFQLIGLMQKDDEDETTIIKETIIEKSTGNNAEQLSKLSDLLDKGHITEDEFKKEKSKILGNHS